MNDKIIKAIQREKIHALDDNIIQKLISMNQIPIDASSQEVLDNQHKMFLLLKHSKHYKRGSDRKNEYHEYFTAANDDTCHERFCELEIDTNVRRCKSTNDSKKVVTFSNKFEIIPPQEKKTNFLMHLKNFFKIQ